MVTKSVYARSVNVSGATFKKQIVTEYRIFGIILYSVAVDEYIWNRLLQPA